MKKHDSPYQVQSQPKEGYRTKNVEEVSSSEIVPIEEEKKSESKYVDMGGLSSDEVEYLEKRTKGELGEMMDVNDLNSREVEYIAQERESGAKAHLFHRGDQRASTYEYVGARGIAAAKRATDRSSARPRNIVWVSKRKSTLCGYGSQGKHFDNEVLLNDKWCIQHCYCTGQGTIGRCWIQDKC